MVKVVVFTVDRQSPEDAEGNQSRIPTYWSFGKQRLLFHSKTFKKYFYS